MTDPPDDSTAVVSWETAVPLAGTSRRTVIEYETLGAVAMAVFPLLSLFSRLCTGPLLLRAAGPVVRSSHLLTGSR
ncbi:hypothetical protein GCM10009731_58690 [Streptomyces globosus]